MKTEKKKKTRKIRRSAVDGEFVSKAEAEANPNETISQTVPIGEAKPKIDQDCESELESIGHQEAIRLGIVKQ